MPLYLGREQKAKVNVSFKGGGAELPTLTNEGSAADLLSGKQLIDQEGNKVIGTFSIDSELNTQDDLIAQIQATVDNLPEADGSSGGNLGSKTISVSNNTLKTIFGFDANGNPLTINLNETGDFLEGIVYCPSAFVEAYGDYVVVSNYLYKFISNGGGFQSDGGGA